MSRVKVIYSTLIPQKGLYDGLTQSCCVVLDEDQIGEILRCVDLVRDLGANEVVFADSRPLWTDIKGSEFSLSDETATDSEFLKNYQKRNIIQDQYEMVLTNECVFWRCIPSDDPEQQLTTHCVHRGELEGLLYKFEWTAFGGFFA